jgi:hypothetical protein
MTLPCQRRSSVLIARRSSIARALRNIERQHQIEHRAWADRPGENEIDERRQVPPCPRGTAEQTHIAEEQIGAIERDAVRHALTDRSARSRVDPEAGRDAFTYTLQSGRSGTVHVEQVLFARTARCHPRQPPVEVSTPASSGASSVPPRPSRREPPAPPAP